MKELDAQRLIIEVVRDHGGAAFKLSNRFLVGVSDLLIKVPFLPAALIEVKLDQLPVKNTFVRLAVTVPQQRFLGQFERAGMAAGIASIVVRDQLFGMFIGNQITVPLESYFLGKKSERRELIWNVLKTWLEDQV